jgi:hypothetical protein
VSGQITNGPEPGKSLALLADLEAAGAISEVGLHLADPDLPYEQFEALCVLLGRMHEAVRFAIGDAIILGEHLYREQAYQAIESIGLSEKGRLEYVRVAQQVPRSVRRKDLSWSHHRAVASFQRTTADGKRVADIPEQRKWLKAASEQRMSHAELRDAIRDGAPPEQPTTCRCCHRPL